MSLAPGSTIGIIGGGQLGRMLAMAAARLGYRIVVLEPQPDCPAAQVANRQIVAAYDDPAALAELAVASAVVTYEFENVPVTAAETLAATVPVYPPARALEVAQDRVTEKSFLNGIGIPTAAFRPVDNDDQLTEALKTFSGSGVLKTRRMGYDGKGQRVFRNMETAGFAGVCEAMGNVPLILESLVAFEREISVIAARGLDGTIAAFDPAENVHREGILRSSTLPAAIRPETVAATKDAAAKILSALDYVGVIGVEFFVLADGSLLANELAPRVHNSGHWTEAASLVSQFEQHIRAVAGLPLGSPARHFDCVMENLIGDDMLKVPALLAEPDLMLHLYGKAETRPDRKMGHFTRLFRSR
ncbi:MULTISPECIES: 5-(carboxyamino)imidazole ribonucleotide synthase [unclassified Mesorhizobium]|uniref:5-(carboxyamino)imidazole ribonucleotide synthase n=1 Tax=unclassified Mesorhizobium TaxID=325217 RepID=UPI00112E586F|nr:MULTISPECIES: 5-(carboxyamino)imidazole ribonucleotide synthase [unclassified Mesorhizobium]TPK90339.1 5-(carboxyamino)imidazole ribonucleotide synthase [Mesorhizobium sp. B2-4-16]TPL58211.1 5-(carboxyamino)imidazole ribonucleotide synthase [Mesorhizobium sp. B2-4-3]